MTKFDFDQSGGISSGRRGFLFGIWDFITIFVLLITICLGIYFTMIFINPKSALNPLQPFESQLVSSTITPIQLNPTWTATATVFVPATGTLAASLTPPPTGTPASFLPGAESPTPTNNPSSTATPKTPFSVSSINSTKSVFIPHLQDLGCNWQGVGGTVDDQNNSPIYGIVVRLAGTYDGKSVDIVVVSGISPEYGQSGFEFTLPFGTTPIPSKDKIYIQLLDQAGLPLSEKIFLDTSNDCDENLVLVRFKKNR